MFSKKNKKNECNFVSLQELKNEGVDLDYGTQCESIQWTRDGQVCKQNIYLERS